MTYLAALTIFHTIISIIAMGLGFVVVADLLRGGESRGWMNAFLVTAIATSVTGFFFPPNGVTPAIVVGVLALVILAFVLLARGRASGSALWRWVYVGGIVASTYLLVFVGIAQTFQKVGILNRLAPTGSEPPFAITQGITLLIFVVVGILASARYRPSRAMA